ncbi:protein ABHD8-like [Physella acuta]|uniref:protein ABHD8-like n=1 Tax=Physella acuta TaxID=109671 RepID=UPI0027DAE0C8|nr:protein ABHD8-like [Physella acuta]XP_059170987.1 protein ABHD8-like [Physella acuta]
MLRRRRQRVGPSDNNGTMIEIRPGRKLRIRHFNAKPRDEKFEKEMQLYIQNKQRNAHISGPLTMPKMAHNSTQLNKPFCDNLMLNEKLSAGDGLQSEKQYTSEVTLSKVAHISPAKSLTKSMNYEGETNSFTGSAAESPLHHGITEKNIRSASSVQVSLHNAGRRLNDIQPSNESGLSQLREDEREKQYNELPSSLDLRNSTPHSKIHDVSSHPDLQKQLQNQISSSSESSTSNQKLTHEDVVLFFIHGVGGSSDVWCSQSKYFASRGYEIVIPDLIGHGFSCAPKNAKAYHFKEIAADLEELFDKYCKRRNIIVGHSYGASFATLLARNRPRRVYKLILISGGPPTPLAPQPGVFTLPYCLLACIKPCLVCGFHKGAFHKRRKPVISKEEAFNVPAYVLQNVMNGQDWPDGDELFHNWLTCPCLLIYGDQDQLVSLRDEEEMAKVLLNSKLQVIRDASHMVMIEAPDEVNQLLEQFIHEPEGPSTGYRNNYAAQKCLNQSTSFTNSQKSSKHTLPQTFISKSILI